MADTERDAADNDPPSLDVMAACALRRDGGQPAIEFAGHWYTWGDLAATAASLNRLIDSSGAAPDAPVAFVGRAHPAALATLLGLIAARRSIRMIYPFQSPAAIARDIEKLTPRVLVAASGDMTEPVLTALRACGAAAFALDGMAVQAQPGLERARPEPAVDAPAEPEIQILTSGTTGPPKRFAITFDMIARHLVGTTLAVDARSSGEAERVPFLLFFPLGNISGIYTIIPTMVRGQRAILLERFTIEAWHHFVVHYRPETSGIPPSAVQTMLDRNIPHEDLASIKFLSLGAAPLDPTVQRAFEDRYGIPILLSYGATEFGGPVTMTSPEMIGRWGRQKLGTVGMPFGGAQIRVVDPATGATLAPGSEGLLEVISPRIGPDWLRTSDIAVIDADGFLFIRGRADGAINRGGFKLLPETIERALLLHPAIGAAAVVAVPDRRLGQVPAATVQFKAGATPIDRTEVERHLREHVPSTHIPVHWRFVGELPKNPSQKIDRTAIARLFAQVTAT